MYSQPIHFEANAALKALAMRLFGYRGRTFQVQPHDHPYELHDLQWGGGTKSTYLLIQEDGAYNFEPAARAFFPPQVIVDITPTTLLLEHIIFCGQDLGIRLHVHPSRLPKLLPAPAGAVTREQTIVLTATAEFKNSYGGRTNIRYTEAHETTGITPEQWDIARQSCQDQDWMSKQGAITISGRQMIHGQRLFDYRKVQP